MIILLNTLDKLPTMPSLLVKKKSTIKFSWFYAPTIIGYALNFLLIPFTSIFEFRRIWKMELLLTLTPFLL